LRVTSAAAEIGGVEGTSFPAYSQAQKKFCIPSLAFPKVAILPNGTSRNIPPDCDNKHSKF